MLRNLGWLLAGKGVGAVLSLVYLGLAARRLGPSQFGQFTLVLGGAQAIAALVGFQSWQIVVRFGAAHLQGTCGQRRLSRLVAFCIGIDLVAAIAGCLLAWCGVALLGPKLGWSPQLAHGAVLFSVASLLSVRSTAVGVLRLLDRFRIGALADATTPVVRFLGALASVACGATLRGFLLAWAAAEIATALAYWIAARRIGGSAVHLPRLADMRAAPADNPGLWRFTWTTNLALSLETGTRQVAVLLVGLATGAVTAGNYRLAAQLSQSIVRVSDMAARAIFAEAARSGVPVGVPIGVPAGAAAGRAAGVDARSGNVLPGDPGIAGARISRSAPALLLRHVTRLALAAAAGLGIVLSFGRTGLLLLGGRAHLDAYPLLRLLAIAAAIDLAGVGFEPVLMAMGRATRTLVLRALVAVLLLASLALLLPRFGAIGAASATVISSVAGFVLFGLAARACVRSASDTAVKPSAREHVP